MSIDRDRKKISQMKKIKAILNPKYFSNISK